MTIYKKGKKEDLGNYRSVSFTSVPEKNMEQVFTIGISRHMKGVKGETEKKNSTDIPRIIHTFPILFLSMTKNKIAQSARRELWASSVLILARCMTHSPTISLLTYW